MNYNKCKKLSKARNKCNKNVKTFNNKIKN